MVAIALLCAVIYYIVLLVQAVMVLIRVCRKQESFEALSDTAKKRYSVSNPTSRNVTLLVCVCDCYTGSVLHIQVSIGVDYTHCSSLWYDLPTIRGPPSSMAECQ